MGMKLEDRGFQERLRKRFQKITDPSVNSVEVGVTDANVAKYAAYVEYGWVQRVTGKQSLFLSNAIGKPVPYRENGKPNWKAAVIKPGMALVNPPRPFLRGTMAAEAPHWREVTKKAIHKYWDKKKALETLGRLAVDDVKMTIRNGGTSKERFPERSPLTMAIYKQEAKDKVRKGGGKANATTTQPLNYNGGLLNSIAFKMK